MNKERVELSAKAKLEEVISRLGYVTPEISSNDKTPSWDGFIRLYKNEDSSLKENLVKMIPIQLKGHFQKPPYNERIFFDINVTDLRNYLKHNGCIFFVVYIDDDGSYKIYYDALTPLRVRRLLNGKEEQKTVSIHLKSFPEKNKAEAIDIFYIFTLDMEMQLPEKDITLDDVFNKKIPGFDSLSLTYRGIKYKNDPVGYFLNHPATVSLKNSYTGISFPVDTISIESVSSRHNKPISIAGVKYYDCFEVLRQKGNNLIIKFGKSFTYTIPLSIHPLKGKFDYDIKGNLYERINDINFILAHLRNKVFKLGDFTGFQLTDEQINSVDINYFQSNLRLLEYVSELLKKLKVVEILDYDNITEKDERTLILLINTVLLGANCIPDNPDKLYKIQLANIKIMLAPKKLEDGNYRIINFFSEENKMQCAFSYKDDKNNENMLQVPLTYILDKDDFMLLDNIDYDMVFNDIVKSQTSMALKEYTYYFIQEMIAGYLVRTKKKELLKNCIEKALNFLVNEVPEYNYLDLKKKVE